MDGEKLDDKIESRLAAKKLAASTFFKVGDKVKCQPSIPLTAQFKGVGTVVSIKEVSFASGTQQELHVKDETGETTKTYGRFVSLL